MKIVSEWSEWVGFNVLLDSRHITAHFRDKSIQAIDCTGTDNQNKNKTLYIRNIQNTKKTNRKKPAIANKTNWALFWNAFKDPGQEWALITTLELVRGRNEDNTM